MEVMCKSLSSQLPHISLHAVNNRTWKDLVGIDITHRSSCWVMLNFLSNQRRLEPVFVCVMIYLHNWLLCKKKKKQQLIFMYNNQYLKTSV